MKLIEVLNKLVSYEMKLIEAVVPRGLIWIDTTGKVKKVKGDSHDDYFKEKKVPAFKGLTIVDIYTKAMKAGWIRGRIERDEYDFEFVTKTVSNKALKRMVDMVLDGKKSTNYIHISAKDKRFNISAHIDDAIEQIFDKYRNFT